MSLSALLHPAKSHFPLAANAGNTTIELSAADATEVNRMRLAYGGSVRMLIYAPATLANPTPAFETVLINGAPTSNVFTVAAMTSEASYTTARGAAISFNLVADAECENYSIGSWAASTCNMQKVTGSLSGVQALRIKTTGALGYIYKAYTVAAGENRAFSCTYKTVSTQNANIVVYDVTNAAVIFNSGNLTSTSWKMFSASFKVPTGCTSIQIRLYGVASGDICYFDCIANVKNLVSNGGFEASGAEKHNLSGSVTGLTVGKRYYFNQGTVGHDLSGCLATPLTADGTFVATATTGTISSGDASDSVKEVEGWTTSNATLELDASNERSGTYCAKVTASANSGYVRQDVTVTDNTWYTVALHGKQSAAGHRYRYIVNGITTSTVYYNHNESWIDESGWTERSATFKVSGDTSIRVYCLIETSGEIVYFDDWSLVPLCQKDPTTETPSPETDHYKDGRW